MESTISRPGVLRVGILSRSLLVGIIWTGLVGPNRSSIEGEFTLSHFQFGIGMVAVSLLCSLTLLMATARLRRNGQVWFIAGGGMAQAAGFMVVYLSHGLSGLVTGWLMIQWGGMTFAVANNIAMDLWPATPRRGVVLLHAYNAIGKWVGPLIAAGCLLVGWRLSFLVVGCVTLAINLLVARAVLVNRDHFSAAASQSSSSGGNLLRRPLFWLCVLPFGLIAGGENAFVSLMPVFFEKVRGVTPQMASLMLSVHLGGLVAGRFLASWFGSRLSNNQIIGLCLGAGLFALPALAAGSPVVALVSLFITGGMFSATYPVFYAQAAQHLPRDRDMLAYGIPFGGMVVSNLCILLSSRIADTSLRAGVMTGPAILWGFGLLYYGSVLSRPGVDSPGKVGVEAA